MYCLCHSKGEISTEVNDGVRREEDRRSHLYIFNSCTWSYHPGKPCCWTNQTFSPKLQRYGKNNNLVWKKRNRPILLVRSILVSVLEQLLNVVMFVAVKGCANIPAPAHGWVERQGERSLFGCNNTDNRWQLTCNNNTWQGTMYNCQRK